MTARSIGFFISHDHCEPKYHQSCCLLQTQSASEGQQAKGQRSAQPQGKSEGKETEREKETRGRTRGLAFLLPFITPQSDLGMCPIEVGRNRGD